MSNVIIDPIQAAQNAIINFTWEDYVAVYNQNDPEAISKGHYVEYVTLEGAACTIFIVDSLVLPGPLHFLQQAYNHYQVMFGGESVSSFWIEYA